MAALGLMEINLASRGECGEVSPVGAPQRCERATPYISNCVCSLEGDNKLVNESAPQSS